MRATRFLLCTGAVVAFLGFGRPPAVRAAETTEAQALKMIEDIGGTVERADAPGNPVVAVSLCGTTLNDDVLKGLAALPELASLDLCRTEGMTSRRVHFLAGLKNLQGINLARTGVTGHSLGKLAHLEHLRVLNVSHCPKMDDCGLDAIAEYFPKLYSIDVAGCKGLTAEGVYNLRLMKELHSLNVTDCDLTDPAIKEIAKITSLRSLTLVGNNRITLAGFKDLVALQNLESLNVAGIPTVHSGSLRVLSGLKQLQTLNVSGCAKFANHSLKQLTPLKQLRTLIVNDCHQLEDYGIEYLVKALPELRVLDLAGSPHISDAAVKELTKLGQLESLNVRRCARISDAGAKVLTDAKPGIKLER